jgi:plasmid stability protein
MPDVLVRNVDAKVLAKLKERAARNGRSLQKELLLAFDELTRGGGSSSDERTAAKIKNSLRGRTHSDSVLLLREDRQR